jgi:hypothetical protein
MGNAGAVAFGLEKAQITLEESIPGMVDVVRTGPFSVSVFATASLSRPVPGPVPASLYILQPTPPWSVTPLLMGMAPERGVWRRLDCPKKREMVNWRSIHSIHTLPDLVLGTVCPLTVREFTDRQGDNGRYGREIQGLRWDGVAMVKHRPDDFLSSVVPCWTWHS